MSEPGFDLHPLAARDITEIWEFIAEDNPAAARRVREDLLAAYLSHVKVTSTPGHNIRRVASARFAMYAERATYLLKSSP